LDSAPLRFEANKFTESDFELPGLPIIKIGILFIIQTKVVNVFSFKAEFLAMSLGVFNFETNYL
jgi:hypothetical protein